MAAISRTNSSPPPPAKGKDAGVRVILPAAKDDRAITSKVGLVAVVGFAIGVAWPRLFGISVGPEIPGGAGAKGVAPPPSAAPAAVATAGATAEPESEPEADSPTNKQQVIVADGTVLGCKNKKGEKLDDCGKLGFDKLAKTRLAELATCPAALGLKGNMTLQVSVSFESNEVVVDGEKKKSELPSDTVRGVLKCAGERLKGVELEKLTHTHPRYTLAYGLTFYPPGEAPPQLASGSASAEPATEDEGLGRATVRNERANLRDAPKEGNIVARLAQGTRVKILEQKDDWYLVESKKGKGWLYRQAIGR